MQTSSYNTSGYNGGKDELKIDHFYGERTKLKMFLNQVKTVFKLQPTKYTSAHQQVLFAIANMRGSAYAWVEPAHTDYLETNDFSNMDDDTQTTFRSFASFEAKLQQIFGVAEEERAAARAIQELRQTGSAALYYSRFTQLASKLDWNDDAKQAAFYRGLKDNIKDKLIEIPEKYKALVDKSIEIDNRLFERTLEKRGYAGPTGYGGQGRRNKGYHSYGDPMDLDAMEPRRSSRPIRGGRGRGRGGYNTQERERRKKDNLCYNCGKSGHMARDCGSGARGLHMMEKVTGIGETKADTPMRKELTHERIQFAKASCVEKAQKEPGHEVHGARATPEDGQEAEEAEPSQRIAAAHDNGYEDFISGSRPVNNELDQMIWDQGRAIKGLSQLITLDRLHRQQLHHSLRRQTTRRVVSSRKKTQWKNGKAQKAYPA